MTSVQLLALCYLAQVKALNINLDNSEVVEHVLFAVSDITETLSANTDMNLWESLYPGQQTINAAWMDGITVDWDALTRIPKQAFDPISDSNGVDLDEQLLASTVDSLKMEQWDVFSFNGLGLYLDSLTTGAVGTFYGAPTESFCYVPKGASESLRATCALFSGLLACIMINDNETHCCDIWKVLHVMLSDKSLGYERNHLVAELRQ